VWEADTPIRGAPGGLRSVTWNVGGQAAAYSIVLIESRRLAAVEYGDLLGAAILAKIESQPDSVVMRTAG
jgi:hypothetical protein